MLQTPAHRHFLVSNETKELLETLSVPTSLEAMCEAFSDRAQNGTTPEALKSILETRYSHLGVFSSSNDLEFIEPKRSPTAGLAFLRCWDLVPANLVGLVAARLEWLYSKASVLLTIGLIIAAHVYIYAHSMTFHVRLDHGSPLVILFFSLLSILAHEMGHASALSRFGATPGKIGFGLYLLMPTFFADVSEVWRLPRQGRIAVDLGGVYFQQAVFVFLAVFAAHYSSLEFAAPCYAIDTMSLLALNPVFRFDGYWLLADWLELPKLHHDAIRLLKHWGSRMLRKIRPQTPLSPAKRPPLNRLQTVIFSLYAVSCNLFLAFSILLSFRFLRSGLFGFLQRLPEALSQIRYLAEVGDWASLTDRLVLTFIAVAFAMTTVFGLYRYCASVLGVVVRSLCRVGTYSNTRFLSKKSHTL